MTVVPAEVQTQLAACLDAKLPRLVQMLRQVLQERDFEYWTGFTANDVDAVRIDYEYLSDCSCVACPLSRASGYCAWGFVMTALNPIFAPEIGETFAGSFPEEEQEDAELAVIDCQAELFVPWFVRGWEEARVVAPHIRGFLGIHEASTVTDLDTGRDLQVQETGIPFVFPPNAGRPLPKRRN